MSAEDFVEEYWAVEAGSATVSINKYMIAGRFAGADAQVKEARRQKVQILSSQKNLGPVSSVFGRARNGKSSPDDCSHILTLAVNSGAVKAADIQQWADSNLGVDCTGFAVAYYDSIGIMNLEKYSGGASCPYLLDKAKRNHNAKDDGPFIWSIEDI
ncbi:MAG: hypothetical protein ABI612_05090, partial [Betaproteobacteria bacterium]